MTRHDNTGRPSSYRWVDPASQSWARIELGTPAAAAAAEYWRGLGGTAVDWLLRDDLTHKL